MGERVDSRRDMATRRWPALAIAVAAMVIAAASVALAGGTSPAAKKSINGTKIARGSEPGNRLIGDSVTGKEVKESTLGQVPSADRANTADSAQTATSADSATTAATANTVGGQSAASVKASCPAGTTHVAGGCIKTGPAFAAATYANAIATCGAAGLPTPAQLEQFRVGAGLTGIEWTSDWVGTATVFTVDMATGTVSGTNVATPTPFRCVSTLSN